MSTVYVFDAFGTLFDLAPTAPPSAEALEAGQMDQLVARWRRKQLEYSWVAATTCTFRSFEALSAEALDYALAETGLANGQLRAELLAASARLPAMPDAPLLLEALQPRGHALAVLSNGSSHRLVDLLERAQLIERFDHLFSAESVRTFKPDPRIYGLVCDALGLGPAKVRFVTANRWDAAGAALFGFHTMWVNRKGLPDEYLHMGPVHEVDSLLSILNCENAQ